MEDLNDKINNGGATADGQLSATEWNQIPSELQNIIEQTGQVLSAGDLNQAGKGVAEYVANGTFYIDSGAADAYVLTRIGTKQTITRLGSDLDGLTAEFIATNTSTLATATVNISGVGVKNIVGLSVGDIASGARITIKYRSGSDDFELIKLAISAGSVGQPEINTGELNPIVQTVLTQDGSVANTAANIAYDDTIPQSSEGAELITVSVTPKSSTNLLMVRATVTLSGTSSGSHVIASIFQDAVANARRSAAAKVSVADAESTFQIVFETTSTIGVPTVFKIRYGASAGTATAHGENTSRRLGGINRSQIDVMEIVQ